MVAALVLLVGLLLVVPAPPAAAESAGSATIVSATGSRPLPRGDSATVFTIRLPQGASCPGDSANDGYRVQSYMVPVSVPPEQVRYDGLGPTPNAFEDYDSFRQPLYDTATSQFSSALTAEAAAPGQPGAIVNLPPFSFAVYGPGELPPGRYNVGISCTLRNEPVRHWNAEVVVAAAPQDKPAGITWTVAGASAPGTKSGPSVTGLLLGGLTVCFFALLLARRRLRLRS